MSAVSAVRRVLDPEKDLPIPPPGVVSPLVFNDTLSVAATKREIPLTKPVLSPPASIQYGVINTILRLDNSGKSLTKLGLDLMDTTCEKIEKLRVDRAQALAESAKAYENSGIWGTLQKAAASISAAFSAFFGFTLISTGAATVAGGILIANGVLNVTNLAFTEAGVWDRVAKTLARDNEEKERMKKWLPAAIGSVTGVVGLAGSAGAVYWAGLNAAQQLTMIGNSALSIAEGTATIGKGVNQSKIEWKKAELSQLSKEMWVCHQDIKKSTGGMERFFQMSSRATESAMKIISMSISTARRTLIQG